MKYKSACASLRPGQLNRLVDKIKDSQPNNEQKEMIPTLHELKEQWGLEKYLDVSARLTRLYISGGISMINNFQEAEAFFKNDPDVFELYKSRICHCKV